jgi:uncharacterized protein
MSTERRPKDRDFIETQEGMLFCVVDYLHPPQKYTAYLKYSPAQSGRWQRSGTAYHRELAYYHAHQVGQTLDYLQAHYPEYLDYCSVRDMHFSMIPRDRVATYYCPETRLAEVLDCPQDALEAETAALVEDLMAAGGIPLAHLGVTGSILLGIHNAAFSDIDLTVYGRPAVERLRAALADRGIPGVGPVGPEFMDGWRQEIADHHGLTPAQIDWLVTRRWNFAYYGGRRYLSLHPVRSDAEIYERYGAHRYRDAGVCRLRAVVSDAADAIFLPALYAIEDVEILEGPQAVVSQVCCYEGLFGQIADAGQVVEARGKLEQIDGGAGYRLVIGSSHRAGREYLLPAGL